MSEKTTCHIWNYCYTENILRGAIGQAQVKVTYKTQEIEAPLIVVAGPVW